LRTEAVAAILPAPTTGAPGLTLAGVLSQWRPADLCLSYRDASMADHQKCTCRRCSRTITPGDTIVFGAGGPSHWDCQRPRVLSAEERALLFAYCLGHPVGKCIACIGDFKLSELVSDVLDGRMHLCPRCRRDRTESVRAHLYDCVTLPEGVRRSAQVDARGGATPSEGKPSPA